MQMGSAMMGRMGMMGGSRRSGGRGRKGTG